MADIVDDTARGELDNDYKSRPGQSEVPVVPDGDVEGGVDEATADSDEQLTRDDTDAIDESNIIDQKTRGAGPKGGYKEPGDEEGLEAVQDNDGTSAGAQ